MTDRKKPGVAFRAIVTVVCSLMGYPLELRASGDGGDGATQNQPGNRALWVMSGRALAMRLRAAESLFNLNARME